MQEKTFCFIVCTNNTQYMDECRYYIDRLYIPEGYQIEVKTITDAVSMTSGYNRAMKSSNARYKIYLHHDVFIVNREFLYRALEIFVDSKVGMFGMVGVPKMPEHGIMWHAERAGRIYSNNILSAGEYVLEHQETTDVEAIDGLLMATQYDLPWREDLFTAWDYYDASQSMEFRRAGYRIVVPQMETSWCMHDEGFLNLGNFFRTRKTFIREYLEKKQEDTEEPAMKEINMENRDKTYILVPTYNQLKDLQICLRTIGYYSGDAIAVVVDNASTDGTREWCEQQPDILYAYSEEGEVFWSKALNDTIAALEDAKNICIIPPNYALTPNMIDRLERGMENQELGVSAPLSNTTLFYNATAVQIPDYEKAVQWAEKTPEMGAVELMDVLESILMISVKTYLELDGFDEELCNYSMVLAEYVVRVVNNDKRVMICPDTIAWRYIDDTLPLDRYQEVGTIENDAKKLRGKIGFHYLALGGNRNVLKIIGGLRPDRNQEIHVLEIGCACGCTLQLIKSEYPNAVLYGTDICEGSLRIAKHFGKVMVADIEQKDMTFPKDYFDFIVFGDVLEHLRDPQQALVYCREFLRAGGTIIASIPNVMNITVVENLLNGDFTYTEIGLLDKTHIHLFTYNEIVKMFEAAGYHIIDIGQTNNQLNDIQQKLIDDLCALAPKAKRNMYEAFQYVVVAGK